jgi:O-acetylserine/cysteine efflux transporter
MFASQTLTSAGVAAVLGNTQPLMVVVLAALVLGERITRGKQLALLLGFSGVVLIASPALAVLGPETLAGSLLALASAAGLAVGSVVVKRLGGQLNLLTLTSWQLALGSLPLLVASLVFEGDAAVRWTLEFAGLLFLLALVGTAFVTAAWYWLIQGDDVGRLSMFFFLVPVFGLGLAVWLLGEGVSLLQGLGLALVIGGLAAVSSRGLGKGNVAGRS